MQLNGELDGQASRDEAAVSSSRKRNSLTTRKVTVQLTEKLYEQLEAATERPGVGKSMVMQAALERFLNPAAPVEDLVRERFDGMDTRFDCLERDIRTIAETVALHARYHLAVLPPLPQSRQREACILGDERFKVLAEQVDRRVRQNKPLMQETIVRLNATDFNVLEPAVGENAPLGPEPEQINQKTALEDVVNIRHESSAAAGEGGSNSNFQHLPNSFCWPA
jgi:metal-responsive CopG/Arc/MetJ family transcriptional regulator